MADKTQKVPEGYGFFAPTTPSVSGETSTKEKMFSETDVRILIMTISGVIGTVLGFAFGLLSGKI